MSVQRIEDVRTGVGKLLGVLYKQAKLLLMVPNSPGLFDLAVTRAMLAANIAAMRAMEMRNVSDVSQLTPSDLSVIDIARDWALPLPPKVLTYEDNPPKPKASPLASQNLSEESMELAETGSSQLPGLEFESCTSQELSAVVEGLFTAMIEVIFEVGQAKASEREANLPRLARTRADFVAHLLAVNMLPASASTVASLSNESRSILYIVQHWATPRNE